MKPLFTILLIISISGLAVFGALAMSHAGEHGSGGCFAAVAEKSLPCSKNASPISAASFHISAFAKIFKATPNASFANLILVMFSLLFAGGILPRRVSNDYARAFHSPFRGKESFLSSNNLVLKEWLSLLEKRDPIRRFQGA